jgi:hypothetical protein
VSEQLIAASTSWGSRWWGARRWGGPSARAGSARRRAASAGGGGGSRQRGEQRGRGAGAGRLAGRPPAPAGGAAAAGAEPRRGGGGHQELGARRRPEPEFSGAKLSHRARPRLRPPARRHCPSRRPGPWRRWSTTPSRASWPSMPLSPASITTGRRPRGQRPSPSLADGRRGQTSAIPRPGSLGSWLGLDRGLPVITLELPAGDHRSFAREAQSALQTAINRERIR